MKQLLLFTLIIFGCLSCTTTVDQSKLNHPEEAPKIVYDSQDTMVVAEYEGNLYMFEDNKPKHKVQISDPKYHIPVHYMVLTLFILFSICGFLSVVTNIFDELFV